MSAITLRNRTEYPAQFIVKKEDQILARLPALLPGQSVMMPVSETYEVVASTVIDGNTYYSAPIAITGATGFLAQVIQERQIGTYIFDVLEVGSTTPNQLQFQTTWREQVTFTVWKDGIPLQDVICRDAFNRAVINLGDTFSFQAVINGITTDVQYTTNPNATCTAIEDTNLSYSGYYTLMLDGASAGSGQGIPKRNLELNAPLAATQGVAGKELQFNLEPQMNSQWSWAAVTASIARYYGQDQITQCKLAQWSFGAALGCDCCSEPLPEPCNQPFSVQDALVYVSNLGKSIASPIPFAEVAQEIDAGRPVVVVVEWESSGARHPVVITGYSQNDAARLTVQDPGMGETTIMAYDNFPSHYMTGATWVATMTTQAKEA